MNNMLFLHLSEQRAFKKLSTFLGNRFFGQMRMALSKASFALKKGIQKDHLSDISFNIKMNNALFFSLF